MGEYRGVGERQTDRQTETQRETQRDTETDGQRERQRQRDRKTDRERDRDRERQRETDTERESVFGTRSHNGGCAQGPAASLLDTSPLGPFAALADVRGELELTSKKEKPKLATSTYTSMHLFFIFPSSRYLAVQLKIKAILCEIHVNDSVGYCPCGYFYCVFCCYCCCCCCFA